MNEQPKPDLRPEAVRLEEEAARLKQEKEALDTEIEQLRLEGEERRIFLLQLAREKEALARAIRPLEERQLKKEKQILDRKIIDITFKEIGRLLLLRFRRRDVESDYADRSIRYDIELRLVESRLLLTKAQSLGILPTLENQVDWWLDPDEEELSEIGRVSLARLIREEKRRKIEWWVKVLTPLLALLVSLLGLLVAVIAMLVRGRV